MGIDMCGEVQSDHMIPPGYEIANQEYWSKMRNSLVGQINNLQFEHIGDPLGRVEWEYFFEKVRCIGKQFISDCMMSGALRRSVYPPSGHETSFVASNDGYGNISMEWSIHGREDSPISEQVELGRLKIQDMVGKGFLVEIVNWEYFSRLEAMGVKADVGKVIYDVRRYLGKHCDHGSVICGTLEEVERYVRSALYTSTGKRRG